MPQAVSHTTLYVSHTVACTVAVLHCSKLQVQSTGVLVCCCSSCSSCS
jgi:hypothetical protein